MVDDFINRKHGRTKVTYPHPALEPILKDTYGVIVYQEQVMQISSALAGYSLGQADLLRRAMGKKKKEAMEKEKAQVPRGRREEERRPQDRRRHLRAHGEVRRVRLQQVALGRLRPASPIRPAISRRYYPEEFIAALLTLRQGRHRQGRQERRRGARAAASRCCKPDVNQSPHDFSCRARERSKKVIRFGLSAVKGVGEGAVESIIAARDKDGAFKDIFDFCMRIDLKRVNKKVLEALIKSGAFDELHPQSNRAAMLAALDVAVDEAQKVARERESGQGNLFGGFAAPAAQAATAAHLKYADVDEWDAKQRLAFEKESLGFYITGHPLDRYQADLKRFRATRTVDVQEKEDWEEVQVGRHRRRLQGVAAQVGRRPHVRLHARGHGRLGARWPASPRRSPRSRRS